MRMSSLGDIAETVMGQAPPGKDCNKEGRGTTFVKAGEFDERFPMIREWTTKPLKFAKTGDVLVCVVGATAGKVNQGIDCAIGRSVAAVRPRNGILDTGYLYHFLSQQTESLRAKSQGLAQGVITREMLHELQIPLPPPDEQKRVATILDQAEELICLRQRTIDRLNELGRAIFYEMFGDPATNSMGWNDRQTLGEVSEIASGITKGRKLNGSPTREVPYLAVVNVQDRKLQLDPLKTIEATEDEVERYSLRRHDLLLTEGGDPDKLGRGTLWNGELPECIHQNHVFRVRLACDEIDPLFLNWLVGSERGKRYFLKSAKQTTGIASINMTQLRGFPLILPPLTLQEEFSTHISLIAQLLSSESFALAQTVSLFHSLQHRVFSGKL
jgi:type I restriction enzyme S subunit